MVVFDVDGNVGRGVDICDRAVVKMVVNIGLSMDIFEVDADVGRGVHICDRAVVEMVVKVGRSFVIFDVDADVGGCESCDICEWAGRGHICRNSKKWSSLASLDFFSVSSEEDTQYNYLKI
jgi:hypothetical protein